MSLTSPVEKTNPQRAFGKPPPGVIFKPLIFPEGIWEKISQEPEEKPLTEDRRSSKNLWWRCKVSPTSRQRPFFAESPGLPPRNGFSSYEFVFEFSPNPAKV